MKRKNNNHVFNCKEIVWKSKCAIMLLEQNGRVTQRKSLSLRMIDTYSGQELTN